jgi:competence protein ComEA
MMKSLKSVIVALTLASGLFVAAAQTTPTTPAPTPTAPVTTAVCKVTAMNVNTALKADLQKIPGVGAKMADAIIAARPFKDEADLVKRVKGIGKKNIVTFRPCFLYK